MGVLGRIGLSGRASIGGVGAGLSVETEKEVGGVQSGVEEVEEGEVVE